MGIPFGPHRAQDLKRSSNADLADALDPLAGFFPEVFANAK